MSTNAAAAAQMITAAHPSVAATVGTRRSAMVGSPRPPSAGNHEDADHERSGDEYRLCADGRHRRQPQGSGRRDQRQIGRTDHQARPQMKEQRGRQGVRGGRYGNATVRGWPPDASGRIGDRWLSSECIVEAAGRHGWPGTPTPLSRTAVKTEIGHPVRVVIWHCWTAKSACPTQSWV